jgi:uncharacterized protein YycO
MAWFTHATYTHVALVAPDGSEVIEASGVGKPQGVRVMSMEIWASKHPGFVLRKIEHPYPEKVWTIASSQIGKGYDWLFLLSYLIRRDVQDKSKLVCSELIEWSCREAGKNIFPSAVRPIDLSPQSLHLISSDIST